MENKLKQMFNYQRFENNPRLAKMIDEAEGGRIFELSDDDLSMINAAGITSQGSILRGENDPNPNFSNPKDINCGGNKGLVEPKDTKFENNREAKQGGAIYLQSGKVNPKNVNFLDHNPGSIKS